MFTRHKQPRVIIDDGTKKPSLGRRFAFWVKHHKRLASLYGVLALALITGGTLGALYLLQQPAAAPAPVVTVNEPEPEPEPVYYSTLTGAEVKSEKVANQAVTAIMIENSPDARPQSGLKESGVVFEAIAEGGITRFLALYQEDKPQLVGPVRSVRMYYVDWLAAFDASVAHVGGSAAALREVRNGTYRDIDQFFNASTYWRATDRYAPHNVYTSFKNLDALNKAKGYTTSDFTGFSRKDSSAKETPNATDIDVTISSAQYNSHYDYDKKTNTYKRSLGGVPHKDREKGQIKPRVVIVLKVNESTVFEDGYREKIQTIGKGTGYIFQDGGVQKVTWQKKSRTAQITFKDSDGEDVPLARGQTWITAVPNHNGGVKWD